MRQAGVILSGKAPFLATAMLSVCLGGYLLSAEELATSADSAGGGGSATYDAHSHVDEDDAIAKNGPIFEGWPQPRVALLFTGEIDGFFEPCGCAGLDNQLGGLKRRHTLIHRLQDQGWPVVPLDLGGFVRRVGPQAEIKYRYELQSLIEIGYKAIAFGVPELKLGSDPLLYILANLDPQTSPIVSANVSLLEPDSPFSSKYRVVEAGGKRIGITSVLGRKHLPSVENRPYVIWTDPAEALQKLLPDLKAQKCDLLVLLAHADPDEASALAKEFPEFQMVATTGGAEEPPNHLQQIEGAQTKLIEAGHKGMYAIVLGLYDDPQQPIRYQRVPLDHRFHDSPDMQAMLVKYQEELKNLGLEGLGLTPVNNPAGEYVGSAVCADCHLEADAVYQTTPHAHAIETLVHLNPPRHFDPECLSCHVTGWNPQLYFPYTTGYLGLKETPHLVGNGCENCHGPGGAHAAAEGSEEEVGLDELERLRAPLRREVAENEGNREGQVFGNVVKMCMECHDLDNSPDFDFQEYWPQVEHEGMY